MAAVRDRTSPVALARRRAAVAASRSGVTIRSAGDLADLDDVRRVVDAVWRPGPTDPAAPPSLVRALMHAGNYCTLAYDGTEPVGVSIGFLGLRPDLVLHSHITGVTASAGGRHVGFALKLDQRAWAAERGLAMIDWTFDPLVRRNAYFNSAKLGAALTDYADDFYGEMDDEINAGQGSDRLIACWDLLAPAVVNACSGQPAAVSVPGLLAGGAQIVLDDVAGAPSRTSTDPADALALVRVPDDIEALRRSAPELAREWRHAVRESLGLPMAHGAAVVAVSRDGYYVLEKPLQPGPSEPS